MMFGPYCCKRFFASSWVNPPAPDLRIEKTKGIDNAWISLILDVLGSRTAELVNFEIQLDYDKQAAELASPVNYLHSYLSGQRKSASIISL